jgi:hypothetical protein
MKPMGPTPVASDECTSVPNPGHVRNDPVDKQESIEK